MPVGVRRRRKMDEEGQEEEQEPLIKSEVPGT